MHIIHIFIFYDKLLVHWAAAVTDLYSDDVTLHMHLPKAFIKHTDLHKSEAASIHRTHEQHQHFKMADMQWRVIFKK